MLRASMLGLLLALVVSLVAIGGAATAAEQAGSLRAGVAKVDITPTKPVMMSGYAGRKELSVDVHDPLSARAIAFEQNGKRLVLLSCDLIGVRGEVADDVRKGVLEACKLQPSDLFVTAIHTHGAPTPALDATRSHANNVEYTKALETKLIGVVKEAVAKLAPAQIGYGAGSSPVGVNRRESIVNKGGKPQIILGRNPAGPTDPEVQVLNVVRGDATDRLAVVFAYATHSTSLGQRNLLITGDIHGMAAQFIEKHLGKDVIAPVFAGASGNIDPWARVLPKFETADGWIPEPVLLSTLLAEEVVTVSKGMRSYSADAPIKTAMKTLTLPGQGVGTDGQDRQGRCRSQAGYADDHRRPAGRRGLCRPRRRSVQRDRLARSRRTRLSRTR